MAGVEFLTNLGRLPRGAYFVSAAVKIGGFHGGPGRAIALYGNDPSPQGRGNDGR